MKKIILFFFLICSNSFYCQSTVDKAKAYYFQAQEQYENGNYTKAVDYLNEASNLLNGTNGSIEALRVKVYYKTGNYKNAKASLTKFYDDYKDNASNELQREMSSYLVKIEDLAKEKEAERIKKETKYYDSKWKLTTKDKATYFRPPPKKVGNLYKIIDYYVETNNKQMEADSTDPNSTSNNSLEGQAIFYYKNGKIKEKASFKKGKLDGISTFYHINGNVWTKRFYKKGMLFNVLELNDRAGNPLDFGTLSNGHGSLKIYRDNSNIATYKFIVLENNKQFVRQQIYFFKNKKDKAQSFICYKCYKGKDISIISPKDIEFYKNGAIKNVKRWSLSKYRKKYDNLRQFSFDQEGNLNQIIVFKRNGKIEETFKY